MRKRTPYILVAALALPPVGCGVTPGERAATGGAIGAGAGAAGAAGAAAGALTDADDIYLGEPFWR